MSDTSAAAAAAAAAAAQAAARESTIESWTLYGIGTLITILRTFARIKSVGLRGLRLDDLLVWVAWIFYTAQTILAYDIGALANGFANNGMTDAERAALSPDSAEFGMRVTGSKIQVAGWATYTFMMGALKLSMLIFYIRLTNGLGWRYRIRIHIGFALVIGSFLASILALFLGCRPFNAYWQINPDPGNACQPAISRPIVWSSFAANLSTDFYLILIPIPILWESSLKLIQKITSTIVLGMGIFVLVAAMLKTIFVIVDPVNGAQLAGAWGTRETFVAVVTTNLPNIFGLIKTWIKRYWPSLLGSSNKQYRSPTGFRTIGGGNGDGSRPSRPTRSSRVDGNRSGGGLTFTESEERIMKETDIKMNTISTKIRSESTSPERSAVNTSEGIVVRQEFQIAEDRRSMRDIPKRPSRDPVGEAW